MRFASRLAKSLLSLALSECLVLNAGVTPQVCPDSYRAIRGGGDQPVMTFAESTRISLPNAPGAVSGTTRVTVATGQEGISSHLVKASASSRLLEMRNTRPKKLSTSPNPAPGDNPGVTVAKPHVAQAAFVENRGQWDARVKFQLKSGGKTLWLTDTGIVFDNVRTNGAQNKPDEHTALPVPRIAALVLRQFANRTYQRLVFREDFIGANGTPAVEAMDVQPGEHNYMTGRDPKGWHTGVRAYAGVVYRNVWEGIDVKLTRNGANIEQEFVVHPGADLTRVQIAYRGINNLKKAEDGSLQISTAFGKLRETAPSIYQEIGGDRVPVVGRFKLLGEAAYSFEVAAHKAEYPLVVDPTLLYSTFLGGSAGNNPITGNQEVATGIAVDATGDAYVTGYTVSTDFPTTSGAFQTSAVPSASNSFVTKLNPTGSGLIYSTYLNGTSGHSFSNAIAVDQNGNAYVAGYTIVSFGFPTTQNAFSQSCGGSGFLAVLNPSGSGLIYSTCFGSGPVTTSTAVDPNGHAFVTGYIPSGSGLPTTPNAYQQSYPGARGYAAFVIAFDTKASGAVSLLYSTFFGIPDTNPDGFAVQAFGIATDPFGNLYVTGSAGDNLPTTPGAFQPAIATGMTCNISNNGPRFTCPNAFVAKFNPFVNGSQSLIYSSYLGGAGYTNASVASGTAITVDSAGSAYVTGYTGSISFPVTAGAYQTVSNIQSCGDCSSAFVTKFDPAGAKLVYSTYIDGNSPSSGNAIVVDSLGNAYIAGNFRAGGPSNPYFPVTPDAFQSTFTKLSGDFQEAFLTKLNPTGSGLVYSSYLGGEGDDVATALTIDSGGDAYVTGHTSSGTFPVTPGAFQELMNGTGDAFVTKFPLAAITSVSITGIIPSVGGNSGTVTVYIPGNGLEANAILELVCPGQVTIQATNVSISSDGRTISGTFDLREAKPGTCNVQVMNLDGTSASSAQSFTIVAGGAPNMWIDIVGPIRARAGTSQSYFIVYGNVGTIDSGSTIVWIQVPTALTWVLPSGQVPTYDIQLSGGTLRGFLVQPVPVQDLRVLVISLVPPPLGADVSVPFQFSAWLDPQ